MSKVTYIGPDERFGMNSVFRFREDVDPKDGVPLDPRFDLRRHSPDGFAWGYEGSGPAQLSLAMLADCLRSEERALRLYQDFKFRVIARLPQGEPWLLTDEEITDEITVIEEKRGWRWREDVGCYEDQIASTENG